jgi:hypothetical protein
MVSSRIADTEHDEKDGEETLFLYPGEKGSIVADKEGSIFR